MSFSSRTKKSMVINKATYGVGAGIPIWYSTLEFFSELPGSTGPDKGYMLEGLSWEFSLRPDFGSIQSLDGGQQVVWMLYTLDDPNAWYKIPTFVDGQPIVEDMQDVIAFGQLNVAKPARTNLLATFPNYAIDLAIDTPFEFDSGAGTGNIGPGGISGDAVSEDVSNIIPVYAGPTIDKSKGKTKCRRRIRHGGSLNFTAIFMNFDEDNDTAHLFSGLCQWWIGS